LTSCLETIAAMSTITDVLPPRAATAARTSVWLGFAVVILASVMDLLDATIAQTAAPAIRADLGGSFTQLEWISAGYTLAMAVGLLVGGRLGDLYGRRQVMLAGMAGFVAASALCALAPTIEALIGARMLQGAVGAVMLPQGFGLIRARSATRACARRSRSSGRSWV
jgi:MFS family permease